jgi:exonuclease III
MKGVFWNCDGFRDPKKHRFVTDLTKEFNLSFIALSETGKKDFSDVFLKNLCAGKDFLWHCKEPRGRSGGMVLGIDLNVYDIGSIDEGDFYVKSLLRNKSDGFKWALVSVYGPAQDNFKEAFLAELVNMTSHVSEPILIGGDFNLLRKSADKNNNNFNTRWPFLFNAVIDGLSLREFELSGRQFTWANSRDIPTYEKLDRILVSTEWELKFPRATVTAHSRDISDHTPLILSFGDNPMATAQPEFKFELGWLLRDGFKEMVSQIWSRDYGGASALVRWQNKLRKLRQYLRGWAKNTSGSNKKEKKEVLGRLDILDKKAETGLLSTQEVDMRNFLRNRLAAMLREEEVKWYQRAKTKGLLEGDANTKYFHLVANGKHRKTRIYKLLDGDGVISGDVELKKHITSYYKNLFGPAEDSNFHLNDERIDDIPQISDEENDSLTADFTMEEVQGAIFQMEHNKAPGPDGFPAEFYQIFWEITPVN